MRITHAATVLVATTLVVTATGATPSSGAAAGNPPRVCDRTFDVVETPSIDPPGARMQFGPDVSAVSHDAVWFGYDLTQRSWPLHWDGRSVESAPPVPRPRTTAGWPFWLSDTAAILGGPQTVSFDSAEHGWLLTNVSALSDSSSSSGAPVGYRWHEGRWTMTPLAVSPDPRVALPNPADIASLSPNDAWLVGSLWRPFLDAEAGSHGAHIQHWDGTSWQVVDNPLSHQRHTLLEELEVVSPTDIWAVGGRYNFDDPLEPVVMNWDGSQWSVVDIPAPALSVLDDVSAAGPDDVWLLGRQFDELGRLAADPLIMRWDGAEWAVVEDLPELPGTFLGVDGLTPSIYAASATDVWVGVNIQVEHVPSAIGRNVRAALLHWDGSTWRTVATPGPELYRVAHTIDAIDGTGPDNIWVAGRSWDAELSSLTYRPVIYRLSCDRPGRGSR